MRGIYLILLLSGGLMAMASDEREWSHPFGTLKASASLNLLNPDYSVTDFIDIDSVLLPSVLYDLRCGDVLPDGYNEVVGVSEGREAIWMVDFMSHTTYRIPLTLNPDQSVSLNALVEWEEDQTNALLLTLDSPNQAAQFVIYNVAENQEYVRIHGNETIKHELAFTWIDSNFDGEEEIITFGTNEQENASVITWYRKDGSQQSSITVPGLLSPKTLALRQDDAYQETRLYFATESYAPTVYAYIIDSTSLEPFLLWSVPLREELSPARLAIGQDQRELDTVVIGLKNNPLSQETDVNRSIIELDGESGEPVHELSMGNSDCVDLSVCQNNEDAQTEIVALDDQSNMYWIDFGQNKGRIYTIQNSYQYSGAVNLHGSVFTDHVVVQKTGQQYSVHLLTEFLDPIGGYIQFPIQGEIVERAIMGDIDENRYGEMIYVTRTETVQLNRLYFYDPHVPVITPTPTPIPSAVGLWKMDK